MSIGVRLSYSRQRQFFDHHAIDLSILHLRRVRSGSWNCVHPWSVRQPHLGGCVKPGFQDSGRFVSVDDTGRGRQPAVGALVHPLLAEVRHQVHRVSDPCSTHLRPCLHVPGIVHGPDVDHLVDRSHRVYSLHCSVLPRAILQCVGRTWPFAFTMSTKSDYKSLLSPSSPSSTTYPGKYQHQHHRHVVVVVVVVVDQTISNAP